MRKMILLFIMHVIAACVIGASARADDDDLAVREPKHWALVLTNNDYQNMDKMPSAIADRNGITEALTKAHFDITTVSDVKNYDGFDKAIREFARKVAEDDLVIVYFSGHGFIYSGSSYIVGTAMPQPMDKGDILKFAIPSETIPDYFTGVRPGGIVLLIDACRSLGAIKATAGAVELDKGGPQKIIGKNQFFMGLAAKDGATAAGFEQSTVMSVYTSAIVSQIAKEDAEFKDVYQDIGVQVLMDSTQKGVPQEPGVFGYWYEKIYINPTQKTYDDDKEAWQSALNEKKWETVKVFVMRNALSPYVRAAKAWLERNDEADTAQTYTEMSPKEIETAFNEAGDDKQAEVTRSAGPFAFDRIQDYREGGLLADIVPDGGIAKESVQGDKRIVLQGFEARSSPNVGGGIVGKLDTLDHVVVKDFLKKGSDTWVKVGSPKLGVDDAYIRMKTVPSDHKIVLGRPIGNFLIPTSSTSSSLVSVSSLDEAINQIKSAGETVTWVSLSTGTASDPASASDRLLQLAHAKYLLNQRDIDSKVITSIAGSPDVEGDGVRMKVLGY
jgi:hypothetical protein